ncbi:MAG: hypothetical protein QOG42_1927 [Solirubrobacteraceae bacterium]|nr:hypothetical protein [Solirubrobacteraceae bacterium]
MRRAAVAAGLALALALGLAVAALGGCGDADDEAAAPPTAPAPAPGSIELTIAYDDGAGTTTTGGLTCRDGQPRATGALAGRASAATLCVKARAIAPLLTTQPDKGRMCTQIYGGPETAHVTGTIDGVTVDRRFTRTNGCEIADFTRAAGLLQP